MIEENWSWDKRAEEVLRKMTNDQRPMINFL